MADDESERRVVEPAEVTHSLPTSGSISTNISAITLKISPFWPADPELCFAQVEAQFSWPPRDPGLT